MARKMVTEWGMSEKLGALRYNENQDEVFLGHSVARQQSISEATARMIDEEVRRICDEAEDKAKQVLTDHMDDLHKLAKGLLEYETLSAEEVQMVLRGEPIDRSEQHTGGSKPGGRRTSVPTSGKTAGKGGPGPEPEPQPS